MSIFNTIAFAAANPGFSIVTFVGSAQAGNNNGASVTVDISSIDVQSGDIIIVHHTVGEDNGDQTSSMTLTDSGFASLTTGYGNDTYDVNHKIHYKTADGTETSVVSDAFPVASSSVILQVMVFRNASTLTLISTDLGTNSDDPVFTGATGLVYGNMVICAASTGHISGESASQEYTSGGDLDQFITDAENDAEDCTAGLGCKAILAQTSFTPAQWTMTGNGTASSYVASTMVLS